MQNRSWLMAAAFLLAAPFVGHAQTPTPTPLPTADAQTEEIIVSATRLPIPEDESPASVTVITARDMELKQIRRVADALREVPGLSIVETGSPGQLTSLFTRGLGSDATQVLLDGIPINQGLAGLFNFADMTTDNIDRIEVVRGPQSTIYGPRAMAGVVQIFTKHGSGPPKGQFSAEAGSFSTFREMFSSAGAIDKFDYSVGVSRLDTDNDRPNNQYRLSNVIGNVGWSPNEQLRISSLFTYQLADTGNPNTITNFHPFDNIETERWLIAPHVDYKPVEWWEHKLIVSYDEERQTNDPNFDGFLPGTTFVGPTYALFERFTVDYQNDIKAASWLTFTSGVFYSQVDAGQERPFVSQAFGPMPTFISDYTEETALFLQASMTPCPGLNLVAGGRYDHFNEFGDVWTYRFAGSYLIPNTATRLHASVATGFSPPSSQDKIFRFNPNPGQPLDPLKPVENLGWDAGIEQRFWEGRVLIGATYFHNDLSNVIGFNGMFETLNLGSAITQGVETEIKVTPIPELTFTLAYTYLDTEKTSLDDINQLEGARLPRRPRNELYLSASYFWCRNFQTTIEAKFVNAREEINFGGPNLDIEDYAVVNFIAEYEVNKQFSIFGRIENLGDEQYEEVLGFPNLGRAAYGGFKIKF